MVYSGRLFLFLENRAGFLAVLAACWLLDNVINRWKNLVLRKRGFLRAPYVVFLVINTGFSEVFYKDRLSV